MIDWNAVDVLLRSAQPMLAATLYPAAALLGVVHGAELHRLGDENIHTVDDYKPTPAEPAPVRQRRRLRRPAATPIHNRLVAEQVVAEVMRERYGTTSSAGIARQMLAEAAVEQQAKAGIRWLCGSCDAGLPMSCICTDLTGAFPVVAVA